MKKEADQAWFKGTRTGPYLTLVNVGKMLPDITNHCNIENHNLVIFGSACSYKVKGIIT